MESTNDIDFMIKQANILGRLARGTRGAIGGAGKGALIGGLAGTIAAPLAGVGLAGALGVGGAGLFSGAMLGGGIRGTVGGLRGLLKNPNAQKMMAPASAGAAYKAGLTAPAVLGGAGLGYMLSDEDNKMMGSAIGGIAGLMARPALVKALAKRAGGM